MNTREFKCVSVLTDLIENDGLIGVKTSFEDEGALFNEHRCQCCDLKRRNHYE
jgi:hypothetical protein